MPVRLRRLSRDDLPAVRELLVPEGWNFPLEDLERLLQIGVALGAEDEGLLGALFLPLYGPLAWIGNVVVSEAARGGGVGRQLVERALGIAREARVETVRLHSVHRAETLYERAGFVREGLVHAFRLGDAPRPRAPRDVLPLDDAMQVAQFDAPRFGADRSRILSLLLSEPANRGFLLRDDRGGVRGYAILKISDATCEIGPAVARAGDADAMRALLDATLAAAPDGALEVAIPGANVHGLAAARGRGLVESFTARTMRWGRDAYVGEPAAILAVGGLEKG